ncbi:MAG: glycosyltransferase family 2 protein [Prevotellaceae bacterium]|nr:glycosyltransferase family 2 protein [Prevotellaceae bacterium]
MESVAVLMTCFNRKAKTERCLRNLFAVLPTCVVYLVDDASTDGTSEMVQTMFPAVRLLQGDGNLFWSRGMYRAWKEAVKGNYDAYLWLNDDVVLYPDFWEELKACQTWGGKDAVVTGLIDNEQHTEILYGGSDEKGCLVGPAAVPASVKFMNGNVVLVGKETVLRVGIIDPVYHHDLGDVDYGLRVLEQGGKVIATRKAVAFGYKNDMCRVRKWGVSLRKRFRTLYAPLGNPPAINFYFRRKHYGLWNACAYYVFLHGINLLPDCMVKRIFGERYM